MKKRVLLKPYLLKTCLLLPLALSLLCASREASPNPETAPRYDYHGTGEKNDILAGIHLLYDWQFEEAENLFRKVIAESPERPTGYFYLAMVTWSRLASGFWSPETVEEYVERVDRAIDVARSRVEKDGVDPYDFFYLGGALGFKGRFELMRGRWLSSFFLATDAVYALKACLNMAPENKDVLFGLGVFDYYTARLSGMVKFLTHLLIHRSTKEEGLRKLHIAASKALYSSTEAKSMLLHIYLFLEEDFVKALHLAKELEEKYDQNPRYKIFKGVSYIRLGMEPQYRDTVYDLRRRSLEIAQSVEASCWERRALYLESIYDLFRARYSKARSKSKAILSQADAANDPAMIAWPLIKIGLSYDLEGNRETAKTYYNRILNMENGAGAQFLAKKYLNKPPKEQDAFIGF